MAHGGGGGGLNALFASATVLRDDIFRSKKVLGGDKFHDYFFHGMGQELAVAEAATGYSCRYVGAQLLGYAAAVYYRLCQLDSGTASTYSPVRSHASQRERVDAVF